MAKKYGVAILGAGWVAGEYVKAFRDHPLTEVIGVYNRTPGKAEKLMKQLGVEGREFKSEDELFNDDRVKIIASCTPPDARPAQIERAAKTGRHVVIEKPIALDYAGVRRIHRAVSEAKVKSVTSFVLRWNPQFITVKKLQADGDAADAIRYFAGEITEVAAFSAGPKIDMNYQYDPVTVASLKFENGAVGKLSTVLDADTPYIFNVRLFGTEGTVQNNRVYSKKHYPGSLDYWTFPTIEPSSGDVTHHPFVPEIAHFLECIENNVESHASIHDSYKSMAVCFAIDESAKKNGTPVKVDYQVEAAPARA